MLKLVDQHELSNEDLMEELYEIPVAAPVMGGVGGSQVSKVVTLPKAPGFNILLHLLNDTPLLRKVSGNDMHMYIMCCICKWMLYMYHIQLQIFVSQKFYYFCH